ncbi:hypothetical protein IQ07DRAFT_598841 [Pyrenochaeta sp. DS3sAY3a]|nr:hypothetical protein IQ07DRAFT_598841 [Pyrenochaeta sp. DS3sAY3a]
MVTKFTVDIISIGINVILKDENPVVFNERGLMMSKTFSPAYLIFLAICLPSVSVNAENDKFLLFCRKCKEHLTNASAFCETELQFYWSNNRTQGQAVSARAADCLLEHSSETIKSNMAAASIIFGLMPRILSLAGPTVAEMSLLSVRYPVLAIMMSIASPAVNLMHLFELDVLGSENCARVEMQH